jgi:hypothetical protein
MQPIPEQFLGSNALQFVQSRGWEWRTSNPPNIELETCPYCTKGGYGHFYIEVHGENDESKNRDGLHQCHRCGKTGNLYALKAHLGLVNPEMQSRKDWGGGEKKVDPLIDVDACHQALLENEAAMDYLTNGRGFSRDIIVRQKIGYIAKKWFRAAGEVAAIIYPYLVNGNCVFWHYRTLPTMPLLENKVPKDFITPSGWDAPLYNGGIMRDGLKEIVFVEGEANCIAAMDKGIENVAGVPGANFKKADWLDLLDSLNPKIYICYDRDKVGQKAAQVLASRLGVERCWKIILPTFEVTETIDECKKCKGTDDNCDHIRNGKDLNEWFAFGGGTLEAFEELKKEAGQFDVDGVTSTKDAVQELYDQIMGNGVEPKYKSPWNTLNKLIGFDPGDVIDVVAPEKIGKTTFGLNLLEHMVDKYGDDGVIICLEMTTVKLARKWVCHVSGLADNIPKSPEEAEKLKQGFLEAIPFAQQKAGNRPGDLYFCYPRYKTTEDIYNLIRDCHRRYGIKWVMLDNLQRLCDTTLGGKNRTVHMSEISKKLSQLAKDFDIQLVRILQPHRIKDGAMVTTDDVDGSSQVAKDCDCMMTLHRNRVGELSANDFASMGYIETDTAFDEKMLLTVGLSRYSAGGYTTLQYDGARSTVNEYDIAKIAVIKVDANKGVGHEAQMKAMGLTPAAQPDAKADAAPIAEITL